MECILKRIGASHDLFAQMNGKFTLCSVFGHELSRMPSISRFFLRADASRAMSPLHDGPLVVERHIDSCSSLSIGDQRSPPLVSHERFSH